MNRKGQFVFIKWLALIGVIFIIWAIGLSKVIGDMTTVAVDSGNLNATESFLMVNMNLWIFMIIILAGLAWVYFGRSES